MTTLLTKDRRQERHTHREGQAETIELGSGHDPLAVPDAIPVGTITPARQPRQTCRQPRSVWILIGLAVAGRGLRNRRLYEGVIVGAIASAAMAQIARENLLPDLIRPFGWYLRRGPSPQRAALPASG